MKAYKIMKRALKAAGVPYGESEWAGGERSIDLAGVSLRFDDDTGAYLRTINTETAVMGATAIQETEETIP